jgi:hypothetical protein
VPKKIPHSKLREGNDTKTEPLAKTGAYAVGAKAKSILITDDTDRADSNRFLSVKIRVIRVLRVQRSRKFVPAFDQQGLRLFTLCSSHREIDFLQFPLAHTLDCRCE